MDIDFQKKDILLTSFYNEKPSDLELGLFDDICTDSKAHIPDFSVSGETRLKKEHNESEEHDFAIFAVYDEI